MNRIQMLLLLFVLAGFGIAFYLFQQNPQQADNPDYAAQYNSNFISPTLMDINNTDQTKKTDQSGNQETATKAVIKTNKGDITLELYPDAAPKTVSNFVKKAKSGFYDNLTFHRVEDWVIQGGDPTGTGAGGGQIATEFNNKPYTIGSLGVARRNDPSVQNDAQFFITKTEADWLNGQYTNFGTVTEGMDVVNQIAIGDKILHISVE